MAGKRTLKLCIDILMTILLFVLMGYFVTGSLIHEIAGISMFVLWIAHHILNGGWYKALGKGNYPPLRVVQTAVNCLLMICMAGLVFSSIVLSEHVFAFLHGENSMLTSMTGIARFIHLICSYWAFVLMSVHFGFHWGIMLNLIHARRAARAAGSVLLRCAAAAGSLYGVYALVHHELFSYMLGMNQFVFFDYSRSPVLFFADYACIMILFAAAAYYAAALLKQKKS